MEIKTNKDLLKFICNQMVKLNNKEITTDDAKAQAGLARQANVALRYKIDVANALIKLKQAKLDGEITFED